MNSDLAISMGNGGTPSTWFLTSSKNWFRPIDISLLPGSQPIQISGADAPTVTYSGAELDSATLYFNRVLNNAEDGIRQLDVAGYYNDVKNVQALATSAECLFIDGLVHADVMVGTGSLEGSAITLNGSKRGNVITGAGDDEIVIRMANNGIATSWTEDFRIASGAGNDTIRFAALDIAAEIASGDKTFERSVVGQVAIVSSGVGRITWTDAGAGDDMIIGWDSRDNIIGGADDGTIEAVGGSYGPTGYAYSVGGDTGRGCGSFLYKIELATGKTTIVGEVAISLGWLGKISGFDVDSLALNPKDGQLYAFATKLGILNSLVKIDPTTGKTTYIDLNLSGFRSENQDIAFDKAGNLYFVTESDLIKVNTATGATTKIANNTLDSKIGALAIDPLTDRLFALAEAGSKTFVYEINKANGKVLSTTKIDGLAHGSDLEGMSFDSAGHLYAIDRISGKITLLDLTHHTATYISKSLGASQQSGDGFESLAMSPGAFKPLTDLKAHGGNVLTGGAEADSFWYRSGDGVDTITDFAKGLDQLNISDYTAADLQVDVFHGDTFIRFKDGSSDGYVDDAMIVLIGVSNFFSGDITFA